MFIADHLKNESTVVTEVENLMSNLEYQMEKSSRLLNICRWRPVQQSGLELEF